MNNGLTEVVDTEPLSNLVYVFKCGSSKWNEDFQDKKLLLQTRKLGTLYM